MKTTLNISDATMREVKKEAARRRQTMSELVEAALRNALEVQKPHKELPPLPEFQSGGHLVDVSKRDALYDTMDGL